MNRASIGVQDFDPEIQSTIGRPQGFGDTKIAIDLLREHGISSINADIVYGLPKQNKRRLTDTVQKLVSLTPERIALYGYAHVPWMARRQNLIDADTLPSPTDRLELFNTAQNLLNWDGYTSVGIDHFALPDDSMSKAVTTRALRRNFQGYTVDPAVALIGLGASAISQFPQGYAQNASATSKYSAAIDANSFAIARGHEFSPDDKMRAAIIESLMCNFDVRIDEMVSAHAVTRHDLYQMFARVNQKFEYILDVSESGLSIPHAARPLTRMIAREFDAYQLSTMGHSSAI
jgi:oxygen-independent coproporphyrinogen-3 oxidase